jgi:hypothetical protein
MLRVNDIIDVINKYNSYHQNKFDTKYMSSLKYIDSEVVNLITRYENVDEIKRCCIFHIIQEMKFEAEYILDYTDKLREKIINDYDIFNLDYGYELGGEDGIESYYNLSNATPSEERYKICTNLKVFIDRFITRVMSENNMEFCLGCIGNVPDFIADKNEDWRDLGSFFNIKGYDIIWDTKQ